MIGRRRFFAAVMGASVVPPSVVEPELKPIAAPGMSLCPHCGWALEYLNRISAPDFTMVAQCGRCERSWKFTLPVIVQSVQVLPNKSE